jgi:putative copper resistance protein D
VEALLIGVRFLHFGAAMLLLGIAAFEVGLLPPGLRTQFAWWAPLRVALVATLVVTGALWFMLETANAGDGLVDALNPDMLAAVATGTNFGQVWVMRLVLIALLIPVLWLRGTAGRVLFLVAVAAVLGSLGFAGHAAMQDGTEGIVHRLNHMAHLLASGFWVGSLLPLLACLVAVRSDPAAASTTLHRFSGLGHVAVALTLVTGVINTALVLGSWPTDFSSPYQALLALKIVLVALMVGVALYNRYVSTTRLVQHPERSARALVIGTIGEIALGAMVVAMVSAFATYDPV